MIVIIRIKDYNNQSVWVPRLLLVKVRKSYLYPLVW